MSAFTISKAGLHLIQDCEGFRAEPAQLPNGAWMVGYGHVRPEAGEAISEAEAGELLAADLAPVEELVNAKVSQTLTQSQFDALVSFAFSLGAEAFEESQVLRRVNAGAFVAAACAMDAWRKSEVMGELEVVDALVRRRAAEKAMFLKDLALNAAPSAFVRARLDHAASILGAPVPYAAAPEVGSIAVVCPKVATSERLTEVLKSEPATEALLLTQVVADDADEEIVTAHAKPVARKVEVSDRLPVDRRSRNRSAGKAPRAQFSMTALENFGLGVLLLFGLALIVAGASMLLEHNDAPTMLGVFALCGPGAAAVLLSSYGFIRTPRLARAAAR